MFSYTVVLFCFVGSCFVFLALDEMKPVSLGLELSQLAGWTCGKKLIDMNLKNCSLYMNNTC